MSIHQHATLADTVYFWFGSNDTSGSGADGASPVYDVRLAGAAADAIPTLSGSATLLSHANYPAGAHEVAIAATAGNGFAAGNTYAVFCTLLVDSQNPTGFVGSFTLGPVPADMTRILGHLLTQTGTQLADGFEHFFDVATPAITVADAMVGTDGALTTKTGFTLTNLSDANAAKLEDMLDGTGATLTLSNNLEVDIVKIHGTALTETAGQLAAAFTKFFDKASPTGTINSLPDAVPGAASGLPLAQDIAQEIARCSGTVWHIKYTGGEDLTKDGLSWDTAKETAGAGIVTVVEAASARDLVLIGPGYFDLTAEDVAIPDDVSVRGMGLNTTWLTSQKASKCVLKPGNRSLIADLTVEATHANGMAIGCRWLASQDQFIDAVVRRVRAIGGADSILILDDDVCTMKVFDSILESSWDAIRVSANTADTPTAHVVELYDTTVKAITAGATARAISMGEGTVRLYDCTLIAEDGSTDTKGIEVDADAATVEMYGGAIYVKSSAGNVYSVDNSDTSVVLLDGVHYDRSLVNGTTAPIVPSRHSQPRDIAETINARPTWYVSGTGDDSDGLSFDTAYDTIAEVLADGNFAAGDLIKVGPGTYSETVDLSALAGITIEGAGVQATIMTSASGDTVQTGDGTTLRDLKIISTSSSTLEGAVALGESADVTIERCIVTGKYAGLYSFDSTPRLRLKDSYINGTLYGAALMETYDLLIDNCFILTDSTWDSGSLATRALWIEVWDNQAVIRDSVLVGKRNDATANDTSALELNAPGGGGLARTVLDNVFVYGYAKNVGHTGTIYGVNSPYLPNTIMLNDCQVVTKQYGTGGGDVSIRNNGTCSTTGTYYDETKTTGYAIIDVDERAVTNVMDDAIPGSPTADSINERLKAIDVLTEAGGDGDLAAIRLDAGTGARTVTVTVDDGVIPTALESARVRFTKTGGAGTYVQSTDASGNATFSLDDGTYTVSISLIGYTYTPSSQVVNEDETPTYSMTAQTITAPGAVTLCTVQFRVKLGDTAVDGAVCKAKLLGVNQASDGTILSNEESSDTTDDGGVAELQLVRKDAIVKGSGRYKIWVEIDGKPVASVETKIPAQATIQFEDLL